MLWRETLQQNDTWCTDTNREERVGQPSPVAKAQATLGGGEAALRSAVAERRHACRETRSPRPRPRREALLPDSLGFSVVMRLASTSTGWAERHAGLNVHVWPPKATRRSPSPYTFSTFPTWPSTWEKRGRQVSERVRACSHQESPLVHFLRSGPKHNLSFRLRSFSNHNFHKSPRISQQTHECAKIVRTGSLHQSSLVCVHTSSNSPHFLV